VEGPERSDQKGRKLPFKVFQSRFGFVYENPVKWAIGRYRGVSGYISGDGRQNHEICVPVVGDEPGRVIRVRRGLQGQYQPVTRTDLRWLYRPSRENLCRTS
jgi:hypothetical protein